MFPGRSQRGFYQHLSYLPQVSGSGPKIGPQGFRRLRMNIQRRERTVLIEAINTNAGISKRCYRTDRQMTTVKVVSTGLHSQQQTAVRKSEKLCYDILAVVETHNGSALFDPEFTSFDLEVWRSSKAQVTLRIAGCLKEQTFAEAYLEKFADVLLLGRGQLRGIASVECPQRW
jgi:hypothetical protein